MIELLFMLQSGGQTGDIGALEDNEHVAIVEETTKFYGLNLSKVKLKKLILVLVRNLILLL